MLFVNCRHLGLRQRCFSPTGSNRSLAKADGWMDELLLYVSSTVFQSFQDDGRVNMKGSVQ